MDAREFDALVVARADINQLRAAVAEIVDPNDLLRCADSVASRASSLASSGP